MRTDEPRPVRLLDYTPPPFLIDEVRLDVALDADRTLVRSRLEVRRSGNHQAPLRLDGEFVRLLGVAIDGEVLPERAYALSDTALTLPDVPDAFVLEIETAFSPRENTALSGIYLSGGRICSQCEAEGFRRITYFLDRPDVLAKYSVRIEADKTEFPTLLSNGNRIEAGDLPNGRHFVEWRDPFPKPAYLFALVGGGFDRITDRFETMSGRHVELEIYVDPGDASRALYAMDALKRSMAWDEQVFGREYDLDLFMIMAVRDFNFGAMENKGLNIFNSALLLADPETATDADYEAIESVVAHEYFHNWTGNRITCRDWFQLCLKEGLTVFRDQEFSADARGHAVQRIKDVRVLRARQFAEDAGPLAHPVRPAQYLKIDNFYTATVYEKGAEVIRMLREIVGKDAFAKGMQIYFERCDGTAATVEDFIACFAEASGWDLSAFMGWYDQAGTPSLTVTTAAATGGALSVTLQQTTAPTPGQPTKVALPVPVRLGAIAADGAPAPTRLGDDTEVRTEHLIVLDGDTATVTLHDAPADAALSVLRGFSAPVTLRLNEPEGHRARRAAHDADPFNRWEAGQDILRAALRDLVANARAGQPLAAPTAAIDILGAVVADASLDPGFAALALSVPDESEIAQDLAEIDPDAIRAARRALVAAVAEAHAEPLEALHARLAETGPFSPEAGPAGRRGLRNAALRLLVHLGPERGGAIARARIAIADNMTDRIAALAALDASGGDGLEDALGAFHAQFRDRPLAIDKWFGLQARTTRADALARVRSLLAHPDYDERTPNRARAVLGGLAMGNPAAFHAGDGSGYALFVERLLTIDAKNPALAARLLGAFEVWPKLEPGRRALASAALAKVRDTAGVSKNLYEIATRSLAVA